MPDLSDAMRQDLLANEPMMREWAGRWVGADEADDLVGWVMTRAQAEAGVRDAEIDSRIWLMGLMRQGLHSVERRRTFKPGRGIRAALALHAPAAAVAEAEVEPDHDLVAP